MGDNTNRPDPLPCKYKTGKTLGHGTYSVVKEAYHIDTDRMYAAKVINKRLMSGREHMVRNEIVVLRRISMGHRSVLTLIDYFETANNLYLITDLAQGGELFDRIYQKGNFYERDAVLITRSITSGVAYLHSHGIVHRDLKPENLLFRTMDDDSELLIADFGLSRIIDEEKFRMLTTTCGTPAYMAPEIFQKTGHHKPVDVWAIGVITYFMLCGYTPFDGETSAEEMENILKGEYAFEPDMYWKDVSQEARDFINKCLKIDNNERMTADEALNHPFLNEARFEAGEQTDLLPNVMSNMSIRKDRKSSWTEYNKIVEYIKNNAMDGAYSHSPETAAKPPSRKHSSSSLKESWKAREEEENTVTADDSTQTTLTPGN